MQADQTPTVILLSGTSSSGKTSVAKALHTALPFPAVLVEADAVFPVVPSEDHPAWRHDPTIHGRLAETFHGSVGVWAAAGFALIVDGSLPYEDHELRDRCIEILAGYDLRLVAVTCHLDELTRRERERPEWRPDGWAVHQAHDIHDGMNYAATIDTTSATPEQCARQIIRELELAA